MDRDSAREVLAPARRDPWRDLARLVLLALVAVVVARMVGRLGDVIGLVLLAATVALLTAPVRQWLDRRVPSGVATALTALLTFAGVLVIGGLVMRELAAQADLVVADISDRLDELRPGTLPARVATALDARDGLDEVFRRLPAVVVAGEEDTIGVARRVIDTLLVVILAAFFQAAGSSALDRLVQRWPRPNRAGIRALVDDVVERGAGYVRRSGLLAAATWVVVSSLAVLLDLPAPLLIGVWAALWSAVPWVGAWIGGAPVVLTAVAAGWDVAVVALIATVAIWLAIGAVRRRTVEAPTLRLGAAPTVLAVAAGLALAGFGGLVVCLTVAALAAAAVTSPHAFVRPRDAEPEHGADEAELSLADAIDDAVGAPDDDRPREATDALLVPDGEGRILVAPGWRGAVVVLGAVVAGALAWMLLGRLAGVAVWVTVGVLVAVALNRPVSWVARRARVPRFVAIGVVSVVGLTIVAAAVTLGVAGGAATSEELSSELPTVVEDLESLPVVGPWLEERDAALWVSEQMENLPQRLGEARDVSQWLPTVGARLLDLFWMLVLAVALLVDGPRLAAAAERRVPARHRRQAMRLRNVSHAAIGGYLAGAALVAGINATVVLAIALAVGIALAPVLAVWAFVWNFVPQIGGFMGGFPLVVLALAEGPMRAVVAGLLFVSYQFVENHLIQPAVISEAIDVPAWVALLAALAGGAAAGVVGAVVLTPLVGVARVILLEVRRDDFPGATVSLDPPTEPGTGPHAEPPATPVAPGRLAPGAPG